MKRRESQFVQRTRIAVVIGVWSGIFFTSLHAAPKPAAVSLSEQDRVDLTKLRQNYAAARGDAKKQRAVVERAIELGPMGIERLKSVVDAEMKQAFDDYGRAFGAEAAKSKDGDAFNILLNSESLQVSRARLLALAVLAGKLEAAAGGTSVDAEAQLVELEDGYLRRNRLGPVFSQLDDAEIQALEETNKRRAEHKLPPLEVDLHLVLAARDHSKDMAEKNFFSHESPIEGKKTFVDRAIRFDGNANGENIFMGSASAEVAVQAWMDSPPHRANMLNPSFRRIGIGRHDKHWTQVFGN
jgi:uncharacterized protein YkwD